MSVLGNCKIEQPLVPIAEIGGREVLGMSGSLVNYINTGNPHISQYDSFTPKNQAQISNKKANIFEKISATGAPVIGYFIAGGVLTALLVKSIIKGDFTKLAKNLGQNISAKAKKAYSNNAPKVAKFFKDIPTKCSSFFKKLTFKKKP